MVRIRDAAIATVIVLGCLWSPPSAAAAPLSPPMPVAFDLDRYQAVDPLTYRSIAYVDNGRSFFLTPRWMCQAGPSYRYIGCKPRAGTASPRTAPPGTLGATIAADQQGPWWVRTGPWYAPSYRFGAPSGFVPRGLGVGKRVTLFGVTCTVPSADTVACRTGDRAMILTPAWHKFYYPSWDSWRPGVGAVAHSNNPAPQQLPPALQYWNQLPAQPPIPA